MGAAASAASERIDADECRIIVGDLFDQAKFDELSDTRGCITKKQLLSLDQRPEPDDTVAFRVWQPHDLQLLKRGIKKYPRDAFSDNTERWRRITDFVNTDSTILWTRRECRDIWIEKKLRAEKRREIKAFNASRKQWKCFVCARSNGYELKRCRICNMERGKYMKDKFGHYIIPSFLTNSDPQKAAAQKQ